MGPYQLFGKDPKVVTPVRRRENVEAGAWLAGSTLTGLSVSGWCNSDG
jgi:hypothetical protein